MQKLDKYIPIAEKAGVELYKKSPKGYQEHYGVVRDDEVVKMYSQQGCFGQFTDNMQRDVGRIHKAMVFFFCHVGYMQHYPSDEDKKALVSFLDWALNRSPYSDVYITKDANHILTNSVLCRTDVPPQALIGAAVLIRHRHQLPHLIKEWAKFKELMNEDLAFFYAYNYTIHGNSFVAAAKNHGHGLFNGGYINPERLKNFLLHERQDSKLNTSVYNGDYNYADYLSLWAPRKGSYAASEPVLTDVKPTFFCKDKKNYFTNKTYDLNVFLLKMLDEHVTQFFKCNKMEMDKYASV